MIYNFIVLADIHNGIYSPSMYYNNEIKPILDKIENMECKIDAVFIAGDLNEKNFPLGSPEAKYMMIIISRLCNISRNKGTKIRIIKGTRYHDGDQLEALRFLELDKDIDFKIIDSVEEESLFTDIKVLYVPEEYIECKKEYYGKYFDKEKYYDLIIFHGLFEKAAHYIKEHDSESHIAKAPVFTTADISKCLKGMCIGGHIHKHMVIDEQICYVGSTSRNGHGEEEEKGYVNLIYDSDTNNSIIKFVKNENARSFVTVKMIPYFSNMEIDACIKDIEEVKNSLKCDYLRIDMMSDEHLTDKGKSNLALLRDHYRRNKFINIRTLEKKKKISEIMDEDDEDDSSLKFNYLFDGTPIEVQIQKFAKDVHNSELSIDQIKSELNNN